MLFSIDNCQNRVSADRYHLSVSRAQVSTHQGRVFFWSYPLTIYSFSNDCRLTFTFFLNSYQICCVYVSIAPHYQTYLRRKNSASFFKIPAGKTFSYHGHVLVTLHVQIYAASWKLFTLTAEADRVLSQLVMFLTVFFHWMYKMKYSCYQECSLIHGWFVYWVFGWEMRRLSKPIIRFRMASFLLFTLLDACKNYKGSSDPCLTW